ncbi:NAD-dependent epimerase/dehydratase family protein [Bacillus sp. NP157]|nr:NAD-dependent epimerase/dehydratase family protein [Bacillus sp. NP157]
MTTQQTALVLGANGGVGSEVARQLMAAGWAVRALSRRPGGANRGDGITWIQGDAMQTADVRDAAAGCPVIVHAVNPPGYRNWAGQVMPMLENTIAAAGSTGALVVLPGTVYNYGPDAFPLAAADAPQHPTTRKGAIRVRMEQALAAYARAGGRAVVVRAGDFFGPRAGNSWFAQGLVKPGKAPRRIAQPGRRGIGHQWAYLPDVAATMVALIQRRDTLPAFASYNMAGHWDASGDDMVRSIQRVAAKRGITAKITAFPWWMMRLATPFNETLRELMEVRYLWQRPVQLDNATLVAALGSEPHTAWDDAVERTLEGMGCLTPTR